MNHAFPSGWTASNTVRFKDDETMRIKNTTPGSPTGCQPEYAKTIDQHNNGMASRVRGSWPVQKEILLRGGEMISSIYYCQDNERK